MARSSSCNRRCAQRPTYDASTTKLLGSSRVMVRLATCEYGVLILSSSPQVIANPPALRLVGGIVGNGPVGGGGRILAALPSIVGILVTLVNRGLMPTL